MPMKPVFVRVAANRNTRFALAGLVAVAAVMVADTALAQEVSEYRQFVGIDSRRLIWFLAQMHLFFGAFVLGVPMFAITIEMVGWRTGENKYDKLAYEFTSLLSVAYATTAALGGLLAFALFTLYPTFMGKMSGIFKDIMFIYALLFFAETFLLYLYYYGWNAMKSRKPFSQPVRWVLKAIGIVILIFGAAFAFGAFDPETGMRTDTRSFMLLLYFVPTGASLLIIRDLKTLHIAIGIGLNVIGTAIMQMANSWAGFMMSPVGFSEAGEFVGTTWQAFENVLATPIAIHRMLGNLAFGGLVAGSYAAVKFISSRTDEDKAHYDWMGYVANAVAVAALIPLPFAGYYLGREIYSTSSVMGNNMMGGDFSWTFIIQAMLVGSLFLITNYYLWSGMTRIPGAQRYYPYIKYILFALIVSFAIWLTPHNLPLSALEVGEMGGAQYHPLLKFLGLMPAKNAVVNLIIIATFFSFLLYRRGNKVEAESIREQGRGAQIVIIGAGAVAVFIVGQYALSMLTLDPTTLDLPADRAQYLRMIGYILVFEVAVAVVTVLLALTDRGKLGQWLYLGVTAFNVAILLGVWGFVVMEKASPVLRNVAVAQFLQLISALVLVTSIDMFLWKGAKEVGALKWGKMSSRSQYALLLLTIVITMNMGLMGFIRSGLRGDWHIFGVMRDTSDWAGTPSNFVMTQQVGAAVLLFLVGCAFMFWLGSLATRKAPDEDDETSVPDKASAPQETGEPAE